jgi:potassium channel LctB
MTRDNASQKLRDVSLIAYGVERFFHLLQRLSPASKLKGLTTDIYIGFWLAVGLALAVVCHVMAGPYPTWLVYLVFVAAGLRITDIVQATVNIGVFDHLGKGSVDEVQNIVRSVVLLVLNYFELMLWFGLIYVPLALKGACGVADAFYFSAVTQLTVGYGDILPTGSAKAIAPMQATLGWFLSLLVIARFVTALPSIRESGSKLKAKRLTIRSRRDGLRPRP